MDKGFVIAFLIAGSLTISAREFPSKRSQTQTTPQNKNHLIGYPERVLRTHRPKRSSRRHQRYRKISATTSSIAPSKKKAPHQSFSIAETNDAAILGLQEALSSPGLKPNDVGYTHGLTLKYQRAGVSLFGLSGTFHLTFSSDLISEYLQDNRTLQANEADDFLILALDITKFRAAFASHTLSSGWKFLAALEYEHISDSPALGGPLATLFSAQKRQEAWHNLLQSTPFTYQQGQHSRWSINPVIGLGFEKKLSHSVKAEWHLSRLQKVSSNQQAPKESKFLTGLRLSLNDPITSANYFVAKSHRFSPFFGTRVEWGRGRKWDLDLGFNKNFSFKGRQVEIAFTATKPLTHNFFDYSDFTTPQVFDETVQDEGGILDNEPVYTIKLAFVW